MPADFNWWEDPRRYIREFHEWEAYFPSYETIPRIGDDRGQR